MALDKFIESIPELKRYELVIELLILALPIWKEYTKEKRVLEYTDTVVGMHHKVDRKIIERAILVAKSKVRDSVDYMEHKTHFQLRKVIPSQNHVVQL